MGDMSFSGGFETLQAEKDNEGWIEVVGHLNHNMCLLFNQFPLVAFHRRAFCWMYDFNIVQCHRLMVCAAQFSDRYRGCVTSLHGSRYQALLLHSNGL